MQRKKRKRGRPSDVYVEGPDGEVFNIHEVYWHRFQDIIEYAKYRPKTFRRRRAKSGRKVTFAETRLEYIKRLVPAVQELCSNLYGDPPLPPTHAALIIEKSIPPEGNFKAEVNKKGFAYRILLYYHGPYLKHRTLKAVRDRVKKGRPHSRPLTLAEIQRLFETYAPDELVDEATRDLPTKD